MAASLADGGIYVWNITADGIAKMSLMEEYPVQGRGGSGVISMKLAEDGADVVAAQVGQLDDSILVLTNKNVAKRIALGMAKTVKRAANAGSAVISLREKETVTGVVILQQRIEAAGALPKAGSFPADAGFSGGRLAATLSIEHGRDRATIGRGGWRRRVKQRR